VKFLSQEMLFFMKKLSVN